MKYSVIIPVYNSEKIVKQTIMETMQELKSLKLNYEIILINDGSTDDSWTIIRDIALVNPQIMAINLLKNYGQHTAVFIGFGYADGDFLITMDDDLQNPPDQIIHLINKAEEGYDLVFGQFYEKQHSQFRKIGSTFINLLNKKIFNKPTDITLTNFRIIKRDIIDKVLNYKTNYPYIPGLLLMYATNIANVMVEHRQRVIGKSNYTISKLVSLTARLLFNYSSYPLRFIGCIGLFISFFCFFAGIFFTLKKVLFGINVPGWTTVVVLVSFLNGFLILLIGIIGEYLIRIINQLSTTQSFYIKEVING